MTSEDEDTEVKSLEESSDECSLDESSYETADCESCEDETREDEGGSFGSEGGHTGTESQAERRNKRKPTLVEHAKSALGDATIC